MIFVSVIFKKSIVLVLCGMVLCLIFNVNLLIISKDIEC